MKRLFTLSILLSTLCFSFVTRTSFHDSDETVFHKGLTCGSCHLTNATDVIELDGRMLFTNLGDKYIISIEVPQLSKEMKEIQFASSADYGELVSENLATVNSIDENKLFQVQQLNIEREGKKANTIEFVWEVPENFSREEKIVIQGVVSNADNTTNGDIAFYKEINLSPFDFIKKNISVYPTFAKTEINIEGFLENESIKIFDILGKLIKETKASLSTTIDISDLQNGNYIVTVGEGRNMQASKFVVVK